MCALPSPEDTMPVIRIDRPSDLLFMTVCNGAKQHVEQPCGSVMAGDLSWMEERYAHLEEQFVRDFANKQNIPLRVKTLPIATHSKKFPFLGKALSPLNNPEQRP